MIFRILPVFWVILIGISLPFFSWAQIEMPDVFNDHMVLQRHQPIQIWGSALKRSKVVVQFNKIKLTTKSDSKGKWQVEFPSLNAGGPYEMTVSSKGQKIVLEDVLVGEVWLCSGQSNMAFELIKSTGGELEVKNASNPMVRLFSMNRKYNLGHRPFSEEEMTSLEMGAFFETSSWQLCTPESAQSFSAVAYHFGQMLYDSLQVPIGLVQNAIGGSTIESWIDRKEISRHSQLAHFADKEWFNLPQTHPWVKSRVKKNLEPWIEQGDVSKYSAHPFTPGYLFNNGIKPLLPYAMQGVIWYQGESNATNPSDYQKLFALLVEDWRISWNSNLPFLFVQLPRIGNRSRWPEFREQQAACQEIENTAMVVAIDEGHRTDVHPKEKKVIGNRLAKLALQKVYNYQLLGESPSLLSYDWNEEDRFIEISFSNVGNGLAIEDIDEIKGITLHGYLDLGSNESIVLPKKMLLEKNKLIIYYPENLLPTTIKYAWSPFPENNLINSAGFPLAPFRIELRGNN